jgi:hypothetical protein
MHRPKRFRLDSAHVIGVIALFVALGGTTWAATQLPKGSVGTKQLKSDAVVSSKVKNGSLDSTDFGAGELPQGPPGPPGEEGPPGPTLSAFASENATSVPEPLPPQDVASPAVLDLTQGQNSGGFLTVGFPARLIATGTAILRNTGTTTDFAECRLAEFPQPDNLQFPFGEAGQTTIAPGGRATIPVAGAVDVPAGTYNIELQCYSQILSPGLATPSDYRKGNLTVIVTPH